MNPQSAKDLHGSQIPLIPSPVNHNLRRSKASPRFSFGRIGHWLCRLWGPVTGHPVVPRMNHVITYRNIKFLVICSLLEAVAIGWAISAWSCPYIPSPTLRSNDTREPFDPEGLSSNA